jgi:hypothetical protein
MVGARSLHLLVMRLARALSQSSTRCTWKASQCPSRVFTANDTPKGTTSSRKRMTTSPVEGLSVARVTLDAPNSRSRSRSERLIAPESSKRQAARGSDGSALCRADLTSPRYDATTSLVSCDPAVFGAGSVVAHALISTAMITAQGDALRMRITPQFSGGVMSPVPWHFMDGRPLQLLVSRLARRASWA